MRRAATLTLCALTLALAFSCSFLAPKEQGGGGGGEAIAAAGRSLPFPWGEIVTGVGSALSAAGAMGLRGKLETDKARQAARIMARAIEQEGTPAVKQAVRRMTPQRWAGVGPEIEAHVKAVEAEAGRLVSVPKPPPPAVANAG